MKARTKNLPVHENLLRKWHALSKDVEYASRPDSLLVEIIRDRKESSRLLFLLWQGGEVKVTSHIRNNGKLYAPPELDFATQGDLRLPDGIQPCGDPAELVVELSSTMSKFVDVSEQDAFLTSLFILSSWFPDCMKTVPYLWLVGPLGSGKSTLLKFLSCVCRRALLVGDVRSASLYKLSSIFHPTLLLDEFESDNSRGGAEVRRLLRNGNAPGVPVARNGRLFSTFGSKAFSSRQPPPDVALASRALFISLLPTQKELLALDESNMAQIARAFQSKLLMFRLQNYASIRKSQVTSKRLKDLTHRIRDLAQGMTAPLLADPTLEGKLIAILREHDREARIERSLEPEWLVVEALFDLCHQGIADSSMISEILVGGVSSHINKKLKIRGEDFRVGAKSVSAVLKCVGLRTRRLGNLGRGLRFTSVVKKKIHELARRLGFDRTDFATLAGLESGYGGPRCVLCKKAGLTAGLRFINPQARQRQEFQRDRRAQVPDETKTADAEQQSTLTAWHERATSQNMNYPNEQKTRTL